MGLGWGWTRWGRWHRREGQAGEKVHVVRVPPESIAFAYCVCLWVTLAALTPTPITLTPNP
jgi:hypothetical protein